MEIVRYIIVFFTVGWGSGIIGVMLFFCSCQFFRLCVERLRDVA